MIKVLRGAKKLIKKGWTKKVGAKNKQGEEVDPRSSSAYKFCLDGALYKIWYDLGRPKDHYYEACKIISNITKHLYGKGLLEFNDSTNKSKVIQVLDKAIKKVSR